MWSLGHSTCHWGSACSSSSGCYVGVLWAGVALGAVRAKTALLDSLSGGAPEEEEEGTREQQEPEGGWWVWRSGVCPWGPASARRAYRGGGERGAGELLMPRWRSQPLRTLSHDTCQVRRSSELSACTLCHRARLPTLPRCP